MDAVSLPPSPHFRSNNQWGGKYPRVGIRESKRRHLHGGPLGAAAGWVPSAWHLHPKAPSSPRPGAGGPGRARGPALFPRPGAGRVGARGRPHEAHKGTRLAVFEALTLGGFLKLDQKKKKSPEQNCKGSQPCAERVFRSCRESALRPPAAGGREWRALRPPGASRVPGALGAPRCRGKREHPHFEMRII